MCDEIRNKLEHVYGAVAGGSTAKRLKNLMDRWRKKLPELPRTQYGGLPVDQHDAIMILYGDNIQKKGMSHLAVLKKFADERLLGVISGIHILPFSPYSSDDGFSVMDYRQVNPDWGTWDDISGIADNFRLMSDLVLNHCSIQGQWFAGFQAGDAKYSNYFITVEPGTDLSEVFRPRALPLTHEFDVNGETRHIWTTFSRDQADLNFANPDVFLEFVDILLDYVKKGVSIVRLDAVGFLWKEMGTSCMHHPKTHEIIKLFRLILEEMVPGVILITETNVPYKDNISYFGNGRDEAHMVYQFTLPPLTIDAFLREDASKLTAWASSLPEPSPDWNFFNFLASHDGIGILPTRGYLDETEVQNLVNAVKARGGLVSYKSTPEGDIPYELNISYRDAIAETSLSLEQRTSKFLASQAIMLAMAGIPGIYVHSLLGSGNWIEGVSITGSNRTINREKISYDSLIAQLDDPSSLSGMIFLGYSRMLKARSMHPAFHPAAGQRILNMGGTLFALERYTAEGNGVLCLQSVSSTAQKVNIPPPLQNEKALKNIVSNQFIEIENGQMRLEPWAVLWLETTL